MKGLKLGTRNPLGRIFLALLALTVAGTAHAAPPAFSKSFSPATIGPGSVSTLTFTIDNTGQPAPAQMLAFTDTLPAGVVIATPANASSSCIDAVLSAPDGGGTITLSDGKIGAGQACTVSVDVTSAVPGTHMNVSGNLSSDAGMGGTAAADLTVATTLPGFSKSFADPTIPIGSRTTLTFTMDNTANAARIGNLDFIDNLPAGLVVASPANASTDCVAVNNPNTTLTAVPGTDVIVLDANGTNILAGFEVLPAMATCTASVDVTATGIGTLVNSTELRADFTSSGKATAAIDATVSELALIKAFTDDPVAPGGTVNLEFTITNRNRNFPATGIAFSDDLEMTLTGLAPAGPLPATPCGGGSALNFSMGVLSLTGGNLAADGGSCTFSIDLAVPGGAAEGVYPNATSAVTATIDGTPVMGAAALETLFVQAVLILTKAFTDDPVAGGGTVTLQFTIDNPSTTSAATNIAFIDELTYSGTPGVGFDLPFPVSVTLPPCA